MKFLFRKYDYTRKGNKIVKVLETSLVQSPKHQMDDNNNYHRKNRKGKEYINIFFPKQGISHFIYIYIYIRIV